MMAAEAFAVLFDDSRRARFAELADTSAPMLISAPENPDLAEALAETEVLITSWGAPQLDAGLLARMPRLRAVFHAAGSIRALVSDEFWARGIRITSAADANAVPVAEFTLATILLAGKRALVSLRSAPEPGPETTGEWQHLVAQPTIGNMDRTIGIVGFSRIGRRVVDLLRPFDQMRVLVADPFADADEVAAAGATLVPLDALLAQANVLSLHAPDLPSTRHMIAAEQLAALPDGATVINTARGGLLDHAALLAECRTGRLDAVLDVTDPEPLPSSSELWSLPNVAITPHLAGSLGTETRRLVDSALDELADFTAGRPPRHPLTAADMETTA